MKYKTSEINKDIYKEIKKYQKEDRLEIFSYLVNTLTNVY